MCQPIVSVQKCQNLWLMTTVSGLLKFSLSKAEKTECIKEDRHTHTTTSTTFTRSNIGQSCIPVQTSRDDGYHVQEQENKTSSSLVESGRWKDVNQEVGSKSLRFSCLSWDYRNVTLSPVVLFVSFFAQFTFLLFEDFIHSPDVGYFLSIFEIVI